MRCCLDPSVANGNKTNKSIDLSQTLMLQTSAFEWRSSRYRLLDWSTVFLACLSCMKMGTLERGGPINWRGSGHQQRALVPVKSLTILLTSFLLLKSVWGAFPHEKSNTNLRRQKSTVYKNKLDKRPLMLPLNCWDSALTLTAGTVCSGWSGTLHISHACVRHTECRSGWSGANPDTEWGQAIQRE